VKLSHKHPRWNNPDVQRLRFALTILNESLHWDKVNVWMLGLIRPDDEIRLAELQAILAQRQIDRDRTYRELCEALSGIQQPTLPLD